jgi:hypothetical protein
MKTFERTSLPKEIKYSGKIYVRGDQTTKSIKVLVLARRLKGVLDYHGKPYKPSVHFYNPK